jgi:hypothetical protein
MSGDICESCGSADVITRPRAVGRPETLKHVCEICWRTMDSSGPQSDLARLIARVGNEIVRQLRAKPRGGGR